MIGRGGAGKLSHRTAAARVISDGAK